MSDDLVIREQSTVVLFSVGPDGSVTHVDDAILDEVAAVLWGQLAAHPYWEYADEHGYAELKPPERDAMRAIAQEALTPLLRRLVIAR